MINILTKNVYFGIFITLFGYIIGIKISNKIKNPFLNPLIIGTIVVVLILIAFNIDTRDYYLGGDIIRLFLTPATICFAIPLYKERRLLAKYFIPIIISITIGSIFTLASIYIMCRLFGLNKMVYASLLPKSVTAAIGYVLSEEMGGNTGITTIGIIISGNFGGMLLPYFMKIFNIRKKLASGIAIGNSSHVMGTAKGLELDSAIGAMSSVALVVASFITVFIAPLFLRLY